MLHPSMCPSACGSHVRGRPWSGQHPPCRSPDHSFTSSFASMTNRTETTTQNPSSGANICKVGTLYPTTQTRTLGTKAIPLCLLPSNGKLVGPVPTQILESPKGTWHSIGSIHSLCVSGKVAWPLGAWFPLPVAEMLMDS